MESKKIIIPGGGGFIGRALAQRLNAAGYEVIVLSRDAKQTVEGATVIAWDGETLGPWADVFERACAVVNLSGKNVSCRYHERNRIAMNRSRVNTTCAVGQAIQRCAVPPRVWVQASTTAIFGDRGETWLDESSFPGDGYPTETVMLWEDAFARNESPGTRRVLLRISFVLGKNGGALDMLGKLTRWGLGGAAGNGRQIISWIHIDDMCRVVKDAIEDDTMSGMYCATGLNPVSNATFMRAMRKAIGRPWSPPVPPAILRLGAWVLGSWGNLALWGRRVKPQRLLDRGFAFRFTQVDEALAEIYGANNEKLSGHDSTCESRLSVAAPLSGDAADAQCATQTQTTQGA